MNKKTLIYEDKFHINFFVKKKKKILWVILEPQIRKKLQIWKLCKNIKKKNNWFE